MSEAMKCSSITESRHVKMYGHMPTGCREENAKADQTKVVSPMLYRHLEERGTPRVNRVIKIDDYGALEEGIF